MPSPAGIRLEATNTSGPNTLVPTPQIALFQSSLDLHFKPQNVLESLASSYPQIPQSTKGWEPSSHKMGCSWQLRPLTPCP